MNNNKEHSALVNEALKYLLACGVPAWKNQSFRFLSQGKGMFRVGFPGMSDIIGCLPPKGRIFAAEAKTGRGIASELQEKFLKAIRDAGGLAFVFHDLGELEREIEKFLI